MLPRSTFQATKTQGKNREPSAMCRICVSQKDPYSPLSVVDAEFRVPQTSSQSSLTKSPLYHDSYVLKRGSGKIYTITDVEELHQWMARCFDGPSSKLQQSSSSIENSDQKPNPNPDENENEDDDHGESTTGVEQLFERIPDSELANDPCVRIMSEETEEAKKVTRNGGKKFIGVWRRRDDPAWP